MVDWTFKDVLAAINSLPSIPTSVLESPDGLCLGDVHFAKICTTLHMRTMSLSLLEKLVANGGFNPECKADGDYSISTAILLTLTPDAQLKDIESMGIRLVVRQCRAPLAPISSVAKLISYVHDMLKFKRVAFSPQVRMFCMIIGNYSGHMAYATKPLFCVAYPLEFVDKKDPATMTFRNVYNHPVAFMGMEMIVHQLLTWDCPEHEYVRANCNGCLIIPRGVQFGKELFPEIVLLWNHAASYCDPNTGKEGPFVTVGPFSSMDILFLGVAGDLQLYTTKEVVHLRSLGVVKPSSAPSLSISTLSSLTSLAQIQPAPATLGLPKISPGSPKVEPDSSSKRQENTSSLKGHK